MPTPYTSIFEGPTIITKKDLCDLLNLDTSRPGLVFSHAEIKRAYKNRALRFHPDKQSEFDPAIPEATCNVLMNDIVLARDHLLNGDDNIPGKAFLENCNTFKPDNWAAKVIGVLNALKAGVSTLSTAIPMLDTLSNNFLVVGLMSTFSDGQLNFRYINLFTEQLAVIRYYLEGIDGSALAAILHQIKEALQTTDELDLESLSIQLKEILPPAITENPQFDSLLAAIKETAKELTEMLTDDFIDRLQNIVQFWTHFIANVPSWKHIMGVFFTSLILTSSNLPKFFNALTVITQVILEQKGALTLVFTALPLLLLTAVVLPINMMIQPGIQFTWLALKTSLQILNNGFNLLASLVNIFRSLFSNSEKSFAKEAFSLVESVFNLTIRLSINILLEVFDVIILLISGKSPLSALQEIINTKFDTLFSSLHTEEERALIVEENDKAEIPAETPEPVQQPFGFFANVNPPLHNMDDIWLKTLLEGFAEEHVVAESLHGY